MASFSGVRQRGREEAVRNVFRVINGTIPSSLPGDNSSIIVNCFRIIFCFRCKKYAEDQNIEIGQWVNGVLTPDDVGLWQKRQDNIRNYFLGR